jgi:hypothetical protein
VFQVLELATEGFLQVMPERSVLLDKWFLMKSCLSLNKDAIVFTLSRKVLKF